MAYAPVSTGILVPAAAADQYPVSLEETFRPTQTCIVSGFDESAYLERFADCELDEHTQRVDRVEAAPLVKAGAITHLFPKPRRRAEVLSWHLRRQGKWKQAQKFAATLNSVRRAVPADPQIKERSKFWKRHASQKFKLEAVATTQNRRDLHREPPALTWGTAAEATSRKASPRIKQAYQEKAEERERQRVLKEAEERLMDVCGPLRAPISETDVDAALRDAKALGVSRTSKAYELCRFVQKDLRRQREDDARQALLKRDKEEAEDVGAYLWKVRSYTGEYYGTADDVVASARTAQMDLVDGSISAAATKGAQKKLPPRIEPHAETFHPRRVQHHYTPGSPTVLVERAASIITKRDGPHRAPRSSTSTRRYP